LENGGPVKGVFILVKVKSFLDHLTANLLPLWSVSLFLAYPSAANYHPDKDDGDYHVFSDNDPIGNMGLIVRQEEQQW
jgi:hypothetical protein